MSDSHPSQEQAKRPSLALWWIRVFFVFILFLGISAVAGAISYGQPYRERIFPGVWAMGLDLGGLSIADARDQLNRRIDTELANGIPMRSGQASASLSVISGTAEDPQDMVLYDVERAVQDAYARGRRGVWPLQIREQLKLRLVPESIAVPVDVDRERLKSSIEATFLAQEREPVNARFVFATSTGQFSIIPDKPGTAVLADDAVEAFSQVAGQFPFPEIAVRVGDVPAKVQAQDLMPVLAEAESWLSRPTIQIMSAQLVYRVTTSTLMEWMSTTSTDEEMLPRLTFDSDRMYATLKKAFPLVEREAKNGDLEISEDRVVGFKEGETGVRIDAEALRAQLDAMWPVSSTFVLPVQKTVSPLVGRNPLDVGIVEKIAVGTSDYAGSPTNRRKNIALGIKRVHGTYLAPGEEFSMIGALGAIDGEHGWLPELVIKGNATKPEYGGGLCQIGTTAFRGALATGLPIVERRNHSYRVRYYEPAGTDATIYDPKPDFRFQNDMATPIFIRGYASGTRVVFEFWGTKDGRIAEQTKPRIYNIRPAPPMKLIETLDLKPGEKKCTETEHAGASAEFTYTVTYPSGDIKTENFQSHYRPWQAVCLIGVEKLSEPAAP